jgi:hypothetical protein
MIAHIARFAAHNGARKLDRRHPGWATRVEPARLAFDDADRCVLGQAYGSFEVGIADVSYIPYVDDPHMPENKPVLVVAPLIAAYARFMYWNGLAGGYRHYDRALKEAWAEEVARRMTVREKVPVERERVSV